MFGGKSQLFGGEINYVPPEDALKLVVVGMPNLTIGDTGVYLVAHLLGLFFRQDYFRDKQVSHPYFLI